MKEATTAMIFCGEDWWIEVPSPDMIRNTITGQCQR
jgi:hypothetical protein